MTLQPTYQTTTINKGPELFASLIIALNVATLFTGTAFNNLHGINFNLILLPLVLVVSFFGVLWRRGGGFPKVDIVLVCLYSLCILPSVLMSEQSEASALKYFSFLSYWIAIIFPLYIFKRDILSIWYSSIIFGLISALL